MGVRARSFTVLSLATLLLASAGTSLAKTTKAAKRSSPSSVSARHAGKSHRRHGKKKKTASWKRHGQQRIASERVREIQEALLRENYLHGEPTGVWDDSTRQAMIKYQEDHGWQTKTVPDSRALIELGLGPAPDHLINPESAMTMRPHNGGAADKDVVPGPSPLSQ